MILSFTKCKPYHQVSYNEREEPLALSWSANLKLTYKSLLQSIGRVPMVCLNNKTKRAWSNSYKERDECQLKPSKHIFFNPPYFNITSVGLCHHDWLFIYKYLFYLTNVGNTTCPRLEKCLLGNVRAHAREGWVLFMWLELSYGHSQKVKPLLV